MDRELAAVGAMSMVNQLGALKDETALEAARKIAVICSSETNPSRRSSMIQNVVLNAVNHVLKEVSK